MPNKTIPVRVDYDSRKISGVAQLNDKQIASLNYIQNSARLRKDLTYVIPAQKAHIGKVRVDGEDCDSVRVFAIGIDKNNKALLSTTLSVNTLRAFHYGFVNDGPLHIEATLNAEGLVRIPKYINSKSVWVKGSSHIVVDGRLAIVPRPFAFRVIDRTDVYQPQFKEAYHGPGIYNYLTMVDDEGKNIVVFKKVTVNIYEEVFDVPEVDPVDCIEDFYKYAYEE